MMMSVRDVCVFGFARVVLYPFQLMQRKSSSKRFNASNNNNKNKSEAEERKQ